MTTYTLCELAAVHDFLVRIRVDVFLPVRFVRFPNTSKMRIGVGLAYGRNEPRFAIPGANSELVYEAYYDQTRSPGASGQGPNSSYSYGVLAYARYRWPKKRGWGLYATAGWGLQYTDRTSVDLDSHINSTPMLGLGVAFDTGDGEGTIGLRFLHISNAGLVGRNQGQNQLFLVYSWNF